MIIQIVFQYTIAIRDCVWCINVSSGMSFLINYQLCLGFLWLTNLYISIFVFLVYFIRNLKRNWIEKLHSTPLIYAVLMSWDAEFLLSDLMNGCSACESHKQRRRWGCRSTKKKWSSPSKCLSDGHLLRYRYSYSYTDVIIIRWIDIYK